MNTARAFQPASLAAINVDVIDGMNEPPSLRRKSQSWITRGALLARGARDLLSGALHRAWARAGDRTAS